MRQNNTNNTAKVISKSWANNDVAGAGMIWVSESKIKFFFTLNGIMCTNTFSINTKRRLVPMIGLKYPITVEVNFNTKPFKYDYIKHITPIVINSNNNFIKENYNDNMYNYIINLNNKIKYE